MHGTIPQVPGDDSSLKILEPGPLQKLALSFDAPPAIRAFLSIRVVEEVCKEFGIRREDLEGDGQYREQCTSRYAAAYVMYSNRLTHPRIGKRIGSRDRCTSIRAVKTAGKRMRTNRTFRKKVRRVQARIYLLLREEKARWQIS